MKRLLLHDHDYRRRGRRRRHRHRPRFHHHAQVITCQKRTRERSPSLRDGCTTVTPASGTGLALPETVICPDV